MMLGTLTDAVLLSEHRPVHVSCAAPCFAIVAASSTTAASEKCLYVIVYCLLGGPEHNVSGDPPALSTIWMPSGTQPPPGGSNRRARTVSPLSQVSKNLTRSPPKRYANVG